MKFIHPPCVLWMVLMPCAGERETERHTVDRCVHIYLYIYIYRFIFAYLHCLSINDLSHFSPLLTDYTWMIFTFIEGCFVFFPLFNQRGTPCANLRVGQVQKRPSILHGPWSQEAEEDVMRRWGEGGECCWRCFPWFCISSWRGIT